jgi:hypothetical protein
MSKAPKLLILMAGLMAVGCTVRNAQEELDYRQPTALSTVAAWAPEHLGCTPTNLTVLERRALPIGFLPPIPYYAIRASGCGRQATFILSCGVGADVTDGTVCTPEEGLKGEPVR